MSMVWSQMSSTSLRINFSGLPSLLLLNPNGLCLSCVFSMCGWVWRNLELDLSLRSEIVDVTDNDEGGCEKATPEGIWSRNPQLDPSRM